MRTGVFFMIRTSTKALPAGNVVGLGLALVLGGGLLGWFFRPNQDPNFFAGGQLSGGQGNFELVSRGKPFSRVFVQKKRFAPNVVLVSYRDRVPMLGREAIAASYGLQRDPQFHPTLFERYLIAPALVGAGMTVDAMVRQLKANPDIIIAEPDFEVTPDQALPNDARFNELWGLHNTGQTGGTFDDDIDAPEAWATLGSTPPILVALMDDGTQYTHVDLAANIYTNPNEIPGNGIDDDHNGYVDDVRGWDFSDNDNDPSEGGSDSHGTHTAGTIAAVANNGIGVAGVARNVRLMPVRMYGGAGDVMSSLASGIIYATDNGAKVISVSYNIDGYTQTLLAAIQYAGAHDVVYVNSAGNNGQNIDNLRGAIRNQTNNAVFVAATDHNDNLASFSNFGSTVEVAAPGVNVLSTVPTNSYASFDGTSMATPHMAGACAMIRAAYPALTARQTLDRLILTADHKPSLSLINGGRLNLNNALETDTIPPSDPTDLKLKGYASGSIKIGFNGSGDDGVVGQASTYDIRVSKSPITSGNFGAATPTNTVIIPVNAGVPVLTEIAGLVPNQVVYVAVQAVDNLGNRSNVVAAGPFSMADTKVDTVERAPWFTPISGPWAVTTTQSHSGSRSYTDSPGGDYSNNASYELQGRSLVLSGSGVLKFSAKYSLESGYDYLLYDVSTNNGATWTNVGSVTGDSGGWTNFNVPVNSTTGTLKIRFRLTSDSSVTRDGVYLDDIYVVPTVVIYSDTMEGSSNFTADNPWALTTLKANSPVRSWTDSPAGAYGNSVNVSLTGTNAIDISSFGSVGIRFMGWVDTEQGYDFLTCLTSLDGGPYVARGSWSGSASGPAWVPYVAPAGGSGLLRVKFTFSSDSSVTKDGVYLDDLQIVGEPFTLVP